MRGISGGIDTWKKNIIASNLVFVMLMLSSVLFYEKNEL